MSKLGAKISTKVEKPTTKAKTVASSKPKKPLQKDDEVKVKVSTVSKLKPKVVAKPIPTTSQRVQTKKPETKKTKPTIMTQIHNVTVLSPPGSRKNSITSKKTVEPVTKTVNKKKESLKTVPKTVKQEKREPVPEPVSFEVTFPEERKRRTSEQKAVPKEDEYDDDFESYESDFESSSSSDQEEIPPSEEEDETESDESHMSEEEGLNERIDEGGGELKVETEDDKKFDSGQYDMNVGKKRLPTPPNFESIESSNDNSERTLDSGIGHFGNPTITSVSYGSQRKFINKDNARINRRGKDLLKKLQLDTITVNFFELKPIPYNSYMKTFGNFNSSQMSTQTSDDRIEASTQSDEIYTNSIWTQYPSYSNSSSGEMKDENYKFDKQFDMYDQNLIDIQRLVGRSQPTVELSSIQKDLNLSRLNSFLQESLFSISKVLSQSKGSNIDINIGFLSALTVVKIFSNAKFNILLTVHESIENVYRSDFLNLIMVWNILNGQITKPIRLLSIWSEVCSADICSQSSDIVVCGLRDGTIALWDLQETHSYCSKLDGHLTHFAPTQTLSPNWGGMDFQMLDLGPMVAVKSFKESSGSKGDFSFQKDIQFASLNDFGVVTIWSLITIPKEKPVNNAENISPWARVKLIQNSICDLREYLEVKQYVPSTSSVFSKRKSYFEKRIFQDDVLKELNEQLNGKDNYNGIRFTALSCGTDQIFIGTNRNFIICCTKSLKSERFRKLFINVDSPMSLFTTALTLLPNEKFILAGLSNGSVIALNCSTKKIYRTVPKSKEQKPQFSMNFESKSCAIQNIILNERRPSTHASVFTLDGESPLNTPLHPIGLTYKINDQQILFTGSVLRKNMIHLLVISPNGKDLYAHANHQVLKFNFESQKEENVFNGAKVDDICVMSFDKNRYFVAALDGEKVVINLVS
ncbi:WDR60 family protein [Megaselia abdita]